MTDKPDRAEVEGAVRELVTQKVRELFVAQGALGVCPGLIEALLQNHTLAAALRDAEAKQKELEKARNDLGETLRLERAQYTQLYENWKSEKATLTATQAQLADAREALEFYADRKSYALKSFGDFCLMSTEIEQDGGTKARATLARIGAGESK